MSDQSSDSNSWTQPIENAMDRLRSEIKSEEDESSGKKDEALSKAREYLDKAEKELKRKT